MKKIILLLLIIPFFSQAQKRSCCNSSSTQQFATLASNEKFAAAHLAPIPFNFVAEKGKMENIICDDGIKSQAFVVKSKTPSNKWLVVFHEWWGLNDYIKRETEKFSDEIPGINVIAIDLYDGQVGTTPEEAQELMGKMKDERCRSLINGVFKYAGVNAKIATIGWCMGGGWSMQASLMAGKKAVGCVMYYGMPETDVNKLKNLNCDVYGIFALKDDWINQDIIENFSNNMKSAGKKFTYKSFEAVHAFANPSNPNYDKDASLEAYDLTITFLKEKLK